MPHFTRTLELPGVPVERLWAFHERQDALQLLIPPGERVEVLQPPTSLAVGTKVILRSHVGPIGFTITAEHVEYERGRLFADRMTGGPFKTWLHRHIMEPTATGSRLIDDIEYSLVGGPLGNVIGGPIARRRLERMFDHRHAVTRDACRP
jgi:hypothetical protein